MKEKVVVLQEKYDVFGDVRGSRLMIGVELVTDRRTKQPVDEEPGRVAEFAKENGVIIGKGGALGNELRINPPLCLQKEDADLVAEALADCSRDFSDRLAS